MYGKLIGNKLVIQGRKKISCIELDELQLKALKMQEIEEFEIESDNTKKFEDLKFLNIQDVIYYMVNGIKVLKTMYPEKGYSKLKIRFIEERKAEKEATIKGLSKKIENSYKYDVFVVEPQEGYFIFDDKLYDMKGEFQFKLDEYAAEKIDEYSTKFLKVVSKEIKIVGRSSYDYTQDMAASYDLLSD